MSESDTKPVQKALAKRLMLNEKSSTWQKFEKLCTLADELGINISFGPHRTILSDRDRDQNLPDIVIEDIESCNDHVNSMSEFPPTMEFKLVFDNPAYIEAQRKEHEAAQEKRRAEIEAKHAAIQAKLEAEEAERQARIKASELHMLAELKAKYPDA